MKYTSSENNKVISGSTSPRRRGHSRSPPRSTSSLHSRSRMSYSSNSSQSRSHHSQSRPRRSQSRSHRSQSTSHRSQSRSHRSQSSSHHSQSGSHCSQSKSRRSYSRSRSSRSRARYSYSNYLSDSTPKSSTSRQRSNSISLVNAIPVDPASGLSSSEVQRANHKSSSSFPLQEESEFIVNIYTDVVTCTYSVMWELRYNVYIYIYIYSQYFVPFFLNLPSKNSKRESYTYFWK